MAQLDVINHKNLCRPYNLLNSMSLIIHMKTNFKMILSLPDYQMDLNTQMLIFRVLISSVFFTVYCIYVGIINKQNNGGFEVTVVTALLDWLWKHEEVGTCLSDV